MTTLVKRNNGLSVLPGLPTLFNDPILNDWFNWPTYFGTNEGNGTLPAVNIHETDDHFEIAVAAPGMNRNDFKVELDNNRLVISGTKSEEQEQEKNGSYLRKEYSYQSFVRSFTLAEKQVNSEKIQANYSDGILRITVPKSVDAKTKPVKVIQIS